MTEEELRIVCRRKTHSEENKGEATVGIAVSPPRIERVVLNDVGSMVSKGSRS